MKPDLRQRLKRGLIALVAFAGLCGWGGWWMFAMPGEAGPQSLPALTAQERQHQKQLQAHVSYLAGTLGERNVQHIDQLDKARDYIEGHLRRWGYKIRRYGYKMQRKGAAYDGRWVHNVEAHKEGSRRAEEIVVVGAHYDSVWGSPGANDNASGVAAMLVLARRLRKLRPGRSLRFVAFVHEEPPYFRTSRMGSLHYARICEARKDQIKAMLSLETLGYYSRQPGSQRYPFPLSLWYPSRGDFLGFVGNLASRRLLHRAIRSFRKARTLPSQGAATFALLPGVGWSDHWSFWQAGYPGIMVTDTAPYRYPWYHRAGDTPDKLDYTRMALAVSGLLAVVEELTGSPTAPPTSGRAR